MQVKNSKVKRENYITAGGMKKNKRSHSRKIYSATFCSKVVDWIRLQTSHYWHVAEPIADLGPHVFSGELSLCSPPAASVMCATIILAEPAGDAETCTRKVRSAGNCVPPKSNPISDKTVIPISLYSFATKRRYRGESGPEDCWANHRASSRHAFFVSWGHIATIFMADIIASHKNHDVMNSSVWAVNSNSTSLIFIQHLCLIWAQPPHLQNPAQRFISNASQTSPLGTSSFNMSFDSVSFTNLMWL